MTSKIITWEELPEAYTVQMQRDGDNISTCPLTSTGYVRRNTKRAMRLASQTLVPAIQLDFDQYRLLRECFRGGNTHANHFYAGAIVPNVHSMAGGRPPGTGGRGGGL